MQTLIPQPVTAQAHPLGQTPRRQAISRLFGYGLTPRTLLLLLAGLLFAIPAFFHPHRLWIMLAWDAVLLALIAFDAQTLPPPSAIHVTRRFLHSPTLGEPTTVELELTQSSSRILDLRLTDDLHSTLAPLPTTVAVLAYPRDPVRATFEIFPAQRGDFALGKIFLRYRGPLKLIERWAAADTEQTLRVFPASQQSGDHSAFYLMRARQIELQKRRLRQRGIGREFDQLREYQAGDELRNISWTATARRNRLITRLYTTERSQQVWIVLDAGRLSRTAFQLRRRATPHPEPNPTDSDQQQADNLLLAVTQLDQATSAAVMLAQVIAGSGDKFALLAYGRKLQQQLMPGSGPYHLRMLLNLLSQVRSESSEADHLHAAARLKNLQRRRGLILWITEIPESAGRPEVVAALAELTRRHLVVLLLLHHPELDALAASTPTTVDQMFHATAAREMLERRREVIARLRAQGVLVVETTPAEVGAAAITKYLEVKAEGLL